MALPYDIWLQITQHLSGLEVERLYGVNKALFNIAMDERYRQISFAYLGAKMARTLVRLRDDPAVAKRVRTLYIHPHFLSSVTQAPTPSKFLKLFFKPHKPRSEIDTLIQSIPSILSSLPNLTEYHISWNGLENIPQDVPVPYLIAPFTNPRLKKVCLDISVEHLEGLLSQVSFERVEELDLFLRSESQSSYEETLRCLAQKMSRLSTLSIRLFSPIDLASFFDNLTLPKLATVKLDLPLASPHLGCPISLAKFLNSHSSTIKTLAIRASQLSPASGHLDDWLECLIQLLHLAPSTLEISTSQIGFTSALALVKQFAGSLTRLDVSGSYLSPTQLSSFLSSLSSSSSIQQLKLGSITLLPSTVSQILANIPQLKNLHILVRDTLPNEDDAPLYWNPWVGVRTSTEMDVRQEVSQLEEFFDLLLTHQEKENSLKQLTLTRASRPFKFEYPESYHEAFTRLLGAGVRVDAM